MATGDKRLHIHDKALLTTIGWDDYLFGFLYKQTRDFVDYTYSDTGKFAGTGTLTATASDTFDINALEGIWDGGYWCDVPSQSQVPFENEVGIDYYVGAKFVEVPNSCQVNPYTSYPEYVYLREEVGELGEPMSVVDNGSNLLVSVENLTESGVTYAGRDVRIYLVDPLITTKGWYEDCVIQYGTGGGIYSTDTNYIETVGQLGQTIGTISESIGDYRCWMKGLSVFRNTVLSNNLSPTPDYIFLGIVTGAGTGVTPTVFDIVTNVNNYSPSVVALDHIRNFVGKGSTGPIMPSYASNLIVSQGDDLVGAISDLDHNLSIAFAEGGAEVDSVALRAESMTQRAESQGILDNSIIDRSIDRASEAKSIARDEMDAPESQAVRALSVGRRGQEVIEIGNTLDPDDYEYMENDDYNTYLTTYGVTPTITAGWRIGRPGDIRIRCAFRSSSMSYTARIEIWKNGGLIDSNTTNNTSVVYNYTSVTVAKDDYIELRQYSYSFAGYCYVTDIRFLSSNPTNFMYPVGSKYETSNILPEYTYNSAVTPSTSLEYEDTTLRQNLNTVYVNVRNIDLPRSGSMLVRVGIYTSNASYYAQARLYGKGCGYVYPLDGIDYTYSLVSVPLEFRVYNFEGAGDTYLRFELRTQNVAATAYNDYFEIIVDTPSSPYWSLE